MGISPAYYDHDPLEPKTIPSCLIDLPTCNIYLATWNFTGGQIGSTDHISKFVLYVISTYHVRNKETKMSKPNNRKKIPKMTSNGRQHLRHLLSQLRLAACKCLSLLKSNLSSPSRRARSLRSRPDTVRPLVYLARIIRARSCTDSWLWLTSNSSF